MTDMLKAKGLEKRTALGLGSRMNKLEGSGKMNLAYLLMLVPGIVLLLVFNYLPMAGMLFAFKRMKFFSDSLIVNFMESNWVGFKNFEYFFKTPDAWRVTRNTVGYNLVFILLGLVLAVAVAVALNEITSKRLSKFYQTSLLLPYFLSWVVVGYLVYAFLNESYGFMNRTILPALGINNMMWYSNPKPWPYIIIFLNMWKNVGYNAVVYIAAISGIDPSYYEAASIDGASKWQKIWNITIPHITPLMIILLILATGRIIRQDFGLFYFSTMNLGEGILKPTADVLDTYVYDALRKTGNIGMSTAAGFYQSIVGLIMVFLSNAVVRKIDKDNSLF
jgi:putative aldouronate transport system permease protein